MEALIGTLESEILAELSSFPAEKLPSKRCVPTLTYWHAVLTHTLSAASRHKLWSCAAPR